MRQGVLGKVKERMNVGIESPFPLILGQFTNIAKHVLKCSIVDKYVDPTKGFQSHINYLFAVLLFSKINSQAMAFTADFLNLFLGFLCIFFFLWQIHDETRRSFHRKEQSNGAPDSRVTTSNNGSFTIQLSSCLIKLVSTILCRKMSGHRGFF